jgi:ketosteroid isomerase-like protein
MSSQALEDQLACMALAAAFAYHVDRSETDKVVQLFTDDGEFKRPGVFAKGHDQLRAWMTGRPQNTITRHVGTPLMFTELGPNTAKALSYFSMYHGEREKDGIPALHGPVAIAEYHDEFRKTADGWRIARRKVFVALAVRT